MFFLPFENVCIFISKFESLDKSQLRYSYHEKQLLKTTTGTEFFFLRQGVLPEPGDRVIERRSKMHLLKVISFNLWLHLTDFYSSGKCTMSGYMHTECFAKYEEIIVGYMSKAGRGRTWNDKQRYANVWANKGYDLVFKTCVCDCGHGSLRKDVDWVPPKPEAEAQAPPPEKKKKKEKAEGKLKPKLNFAVQTVQGSYYGSANREEEDGEDKPAPSLPSMRAFVRETSVDILVPCTPTTPKSSTPAAIPGLASLLPASSKTKTEPKVERSISQASLSSLPTSSVENDPDGWITVSKAKERSESGSRRNSVHQIKPRDVGKKRWPSGDSTSSMQSNPGSYLSNSSSGNTNGAVGETAVKTSKCATPEPSLAAEAARKLQKSTSKSPLEVRIHL